MTNYVVTHSLISCGLYPTGGGVLPTYYVEGDIVTDDDLMPGDPDSGDGEDVIGTDYTDIWNWSTRTSVPPNDVAQPISGQVRTNSGDWANATILVIATQTDAGLDVTAELADRLAGSGITISQASDPTQNAEFVTNMDAVPTDTFVGYAVTYLSGAGQPPKNYTQISVTLSNRPPNYATSAYVQRMCDLGAIAPITS